MLGEIIQAAKTKYMTAVKRKRSQQQFETDAALEILPIQLAEILKYLLFRHFHGRNLTVLCGIPCQSAPGKLPEMLLGYFGGEDSLSLFLRGFSCGPFFISIPGLHFTIYLMSMLIYTNTFLSQFYW